MFFCKWHFFFLHFHNVRVIFHCLSQTFISPFICTQWFSLLSSLGHCECCCSACFWVWRFGYVFSMICWLLKYYKSRTDVWKSSLILIPKPFDSHAQRSSNHLPPTSVIQGHPLLIIALLFLVCGVLGSGLYGFSVSLQFTFSNHWKQSKWGTFLEASF